MSKVDELKEALHNDMLGCVAAGVANSDIGWSMMADSFLYTLEDLIKAVRQEERDRVDALLMKYELHDHTVCHGGEPTWLVNRRDEELTGHHTLYSRPIDALLSKEGHKEELRTCERCKHGPPKVSGAACLYCLGPQEGLSNWEKK